MTFQTRKTFVNFQYTNYFIIFQEIQKLSDSA